jgi:hypothetical protein
MLDDEENPLDIEKLRADGYVAQPVQTQTKATKRRKRADPFVQVPLSLMERLGGHGAVLTVAIYLHHQNWKHPGELITVSNKALSSTALLKLEMLGMVEIERHGMRAPRVKLL